MVLGETIRWRISIIGIFFLLLFQNSIAQHNDEAWTGLNLNFDLKNKWDAALRQESRIYITDQTFNNIFSDLKLGKGINEKLSAAAGVRVSHRNKSEINVNYLRYYGFILWQGKNNLIRINARSGIQHDDVLKPEPGTNIYSSTIWRNLAELGFSVPGSRLSALVFCELFKSVSVSDAINFEELRLKPYIRFDISDKHQLNSGYLYRYNYLRNAREGHIFTVNYTIKLGHN